MKAVASKSYRTGQWFAEVGNTINDPFPRSYEITTQEDIAYLEIGNRDGEEIEGEIHSDDRRTYIFCLTKVKVDHRMFAYNGLDTSQAEYSSNVLQGVDRWPKEKTTPPIHSDPAGEIWLLLNDIRLYFENDADGDKEKLYSRIGKALAKPSTPQTGTDTENDAIWEDGYSKGSIVNSDKLERLAKWILPAQSEYNIKEVVQMFIKNDLLEHPTPQTGRTYTEGELMENLWYLWVLTGKYKTWQIDNIAKEEFHDWIKIDTYIPFKQNPKPLDRSGGLDEDFKWDNQLVRRFAEQYEEYKHGCYYNGTDESKIKSMEEFMREFKIKYQP